MRPDGPGGEATHVVVVRTLGSGRRQLLPRRPRARDAAPEPEPAKVAVGRVTIVDARPGPAAAAERWLAAAGAAEADAGLVELARVVRAHRIASGDPGVPLPRLTQALAVRVGYGAGEEVADGRWSAARELPPAGEEPGRRRRGRMLHPQERLAALLGGRSHALACEELTLRARHDLDHGQLREAALQLRTALDAALAELPATPQATALEGRVAELAELRGSTAALADDALGGVIPPDAATALEATLRRLEAALRARTAAEANAAL